jgi:hypothetical protein
MADLFDTVPDEFQIDYLLAAQVEEGIRDFAFEAGMHSFNAYVHSGAYAELLKELDASPVPPKFEFDATGQVSLDGTITEDTVNLFGKPDIWYQTKSGIDVIRDWKVTGYCSKSAATPYKCYSSIYDGWDHEKIKPSRSHGKSHKEFEPKEIDGVIINGAHSFEYGCSAYADQVTIYSWLQGCEVGSEVIIGIEQLACNTKGNLQILDGNSNNKVPVDVPLIRVAKHMGTVSKEYQEELIGKAQEAWDIIRSGFIFKGCYNAEKREEYTREESDKEVSRLNLVCDNLHELGHDFAMHSLQLSKRGFF